MASVAVAAAAAASASGPRLSLDAVRNQFPALAKGLICLNNGSGALVHKGCMDSIVRTMSAPHMNLRGIDATSNIDIKVRKAQTAQIASFMNADPDEIAFGLSTTGMLRTLASSIQPNLSPDAEMIVSILCHEAGISAWVALAKTLGIAIKWWVPPGGMGNNLDPKLTLDSLRSLLTPKTRLVCMGHVSNITGTIEPVQEIAQLVHQVPEAQLCVDGVAWAPHRPLDVKALDVDFYVFSWYKVFGPHLSQLYARRRTQQRYLESLNHYFFQSPPLSARLGLGNHCIELEHSVVPIVEHITQAVGWDSIISHEAELTEYLLSYLTANADLYTVYGSQSADPEARVSLISFSVKGIASSKVVQMIHETSNCRLISGDCWSPRTVHEVIGRPDDGIVRVSLVHYNTLEELEVFIQKLDQVVKTLRK